MQQAPGVKPAKRRLCTAAIKGPQRSERYKKRSADSDFAKTNSKLSLHPKELRPSDKDRSGRAPLERSPNLSWIYILYLQIISGTCVTAAQNSCHKFVIFL